MEADWEVEIGAEAPVIDASWDGFVDLQRAPQQAHQLQESADLPGLSNALVRLNAPASPVWTSKCDVWPVPDPEQLDPYEMEVPAGCISHAWTCYIDLLPRSDQQWIAPEMAVSWCKDLVACLRAISLPCCRADLVVRSAAIVSAPTDIGLTAYLTGCGSTSNEARGTLQNALVQFTEALISLPTVK